MRLRVRTLTSLTAAHTASMTDDSGGVSRQVIGEAFTLRAALWPPKRRLVRTLSGMRVAQVWTLLCEQDAALMMHDRVTLQGDARTFLVTALRRFPRHLEADLELLQ